LSASSRCGDRSCLRFLRQIERETPPQLTLHLIVDNYATHKHPAVKAWLARHPRVRPHFTPTSSSWLNLVERFFRDLTEEVVRDGRWYSNFPDSVDNDYL
jgi:transposase